MVFNSFHFIIFFSTFVFLYFVAPKKYRIHVLLLGSCYFYMVYIPAYILVLFFLIIVDFFLGKKIEKTEGQQKKMFLLISICTNLLTLFIFKYFNFFNENIAALARLIHWNYSLLTLQLALPIGLSFHVFQSLSYVIEVYKKRQQAETDFIVYASYVMFFPQLVAGPIERPQHLLPQLHAEHLFQSRRVTQGLEFILWGFFKKLVIADRLAVVVDSIYGNLHAANGGLLILAVLLFSYQLYCDFSGYSDIAVGSALVLGYDITKNFNRPFASKTIAEFWRRWHISLSNWLRDYVYYSLIFGNKKITQLRLYGSLMITMVLIGLWHGANWTFVVMGAIHGTYLCIGSLTNNWRRSFARALGVIKFPKLYKAWQISITFVLISISLIFFRAPNLNDAFFVLTHIGQGLGTISDIGVLKNPLLTTITNINGFFKINVPLTLLALAFLEGMQYYQTKMGTFHIFEFRPRWTRLLWYYALSFSVIFLGYFLGTGGFIYFQF